MTLTTLTATNPLSWTTIGPLALRENWTVVGGSVQLTTDPVVDDYQGVHLKLGQSVDFAAGVTVYVRASADTAKVNRETSLAQGFTTADRVLTGPAGLVAINTDLLTGAVNGWLDVSQYSTIAIQVIGSAAVSGGAVIFEQTNDPVLAPAGAAVPAAETLSLSANPVNTAVTIAASTARLFVVQPTAAYVRCRVSTAFTGGTVQAVAMLRQKTVDFPVVNVQQATSSNLSVSAVPVSGTTFTLLSAASNNLTSVKATSGAVHSISLFNFGATTRFVKLFNKASAPILGTDLPILTIPIAPGAYFTETFGFMGLRSPLGIAMAITANAADADATAVAAGDVRVTIAFV